MKISRRKAVQFVLSILAAFGFLMVLGAVGDADNGATIDAILGRIFGGYTIAGVALLVQNWLGL